MPKPTLIADESRRAPWIALWYLGQMMRFAFTVLVALWPGVIQADTHVVFLESQDGTRIPIATIDVASDGAYEIDYTTSAFSDHFLSMRPFKCVDASEKLWCHVPYPYEIQRSLTEDLVDLEYDLLFVWKGSGDYGIDMWNGVYYRLTSEGDQIIGHLHEVDLGRLAVPPEPGNLRPLRLVDLEEGDPGSHPLPRVVIKPAEP